MLKRKANIKLFTGILIVVSIFIFIGISTYFEKTGDYISLLNYERNYSDDIPKNYTNEVVDVAKLEAHSIMVDDSEKIVGFTLDNDASACFEILRTQLLSHGWNYVESGSSTSASFYKNEGLYKWLFVNCVSVGGETSVVLTVD